MTICSVIQLYMYHIVKDIEVKYEYVKLTTIDLIGR